jgi:hypothetical protein
MQVHEVVKQAPFFRPQKIAQVKFVGIVALFLDAATNWDIVGYVHKIDVWHISQWVSCDIVYYTVVL